MSDDSFPVFSSPPSVLAVDLVLEPGESKTCLSFAILQMPPLLTSGVQTPSRFAYRATCRPPSEERRLASIIPSWLAQTARRIGLQASLGSNPGLSAFRYGYTITSRVSWLVRILVAS